MRDGEFFDMSDILVIINRINDVIMEETDGECQVEIFSLGEPKLYSNATKNNVFVFVKLGYT